MLIYQICKSIQVTKQMNEFANDDYVNSMQVKQQQFFYRLVTHVIILYTL